MFSVFGTLFLFDKVHEGKIKSYNSCIASRVIEEKVIPSVETKEISFNTTKTIKAEELNTCDTKRYPAQFFLDHIAGEGVGYQKGYSTLGLFLSKFNEEESLRFLECRGHIFNDGKLAANIGVGLRKKVLEKYLVLGINGFYDYRRDLNHNFHQFGMGLEFLGKVISGRINGYFPVGKKEKIVGYSFDNFAGNNLYLTKHSKIAMTGLDAEAEAIIFDRKNAQVKTEIGSYYFKGDFGKSALGGKVGLNASLFQWLFVGGSITYDKVFHCNVQGEISLRYGFCKEKKRKTKYSCKRFHAITKRMEQPVKRYDIIVLSNQKGSTIALSPNPGEPITFYHVNNTAKSGNGTYESPFPTLVEAQSIAQAGDTIFVNYGNGTSSGMSNGITLKDRQNLFGSSIEHPINTTIGTITIPAMTPGNYPMILSTTLSNPGITLANDNTVRGIAIGSSSGSGVYGSGVQIGSRIQKNLILDNGSGAGSDAGIMLLLASDVQIEKTFEISDNIITGSASGNDGIFIGQADGTPINGTASIDLLITRNDIIGNPSEGIHISRPDDTSVGLFRVTGKISQNEITGNGADGIFFNHTIASGSSLDLNLEILDNIIAANASEGIVFTSRAAGYLNISRNVIDNSVSSCIYVNVGQTEIAENLNYDVIGNQLNYNGGSGFYTNLQNGTIRMRLIDNFFQTGATSTYTYLRNSTGTTDNFTAVIQGNEGPAVLLNIKQVTEL